LVLIINKEDVAQKEIIFDGLRNLGLMAEEKKITLKENKLEIAAELMLGEEKLKAVHQYLLNNKCIREFSF